jgi:hypothetical protein
MQFLFVELHHPLFQSVVMTFGVLPKKRGSRTSLVVLLECWGLEATCTANNYKAFLFRSITQEARVPAPHFARCPVRMEC